MMNMDGSEPVGQTRDAQLEALGARLARLEKKNRRERRWLVLALACGIAFSSSVLVAQSSWAPPGFNVFSANTPAKAADVNTNFQWLIENPGAAFLTTGSCPSGYTAHTGGQYIRLGTPNLTPVAGDLTVPAHRHDTLSNVTVSSDGSHTHSYNDYYWHDSGDTGDYGTPTGDGVGQRLQVGRTTGSGGSHNHTLSGTVGPLAGQNGDSPMSVTGNLPHITLRLCVHN